MLRLMTVFVVLLALTSSAFALDQAEQSDDSLMCATFAAPCEQLRLSDQPGYIDFNKTKFEIGDSVYVLPELAVIVDTNGYLLPYQFPKTKTGVVVRVCSVGAEQYIGIKESLGEESLEVFFPIWQISQQSAVSPW